VAIGLSPPNRMILDDAGRAIYRSPVALRVPNPTQKAVRAVGRLAGSDAGRRRTDASSAGCGTGYSPLPVAGPRKEVHRPPLAECSRSRRSATAIPIPDPRGRWRSQVTAPSALVVLVAGMPGITAFGWAISLPSCGLAQFSDHLPGIRSRRSGSNRIPVSGCARSSPVGPSRGTGRRCFGCMSGELYAVSHRALHC
jgi:hypothetical protein